MQTPLVDGTVVQLSVEVGEIKSNNDGKKAVQQLSKLFAVLERVICAVSAGDGATWKDGVTAPPASWSPEPGITAAADAYGVAHAFLGRVITSAPLELKEDWLLTSSTGVRFLRPGHVRFVSTSVT